MGSWNVGKEAKVTYEILTPSGWQRFDNIVLNNKESAEILTSKGIIVASLDHRFIVDEKEVRCRSLRPRDKLTNTVSVVSVKLLGKMDVYDVTNVRGGNVYLHDSNVVSHNCFLGSSMQLLSSGTMKTLSHKIPLRTLNDQYKGGLIYEMPKPGHNYVMTVDVSRGRHLDSSAFLIIDVTEYPHRIVASYNNKEIPPMRYALLLHHFGKQYNMAYMLIEINDIGAQVADILWHDYEYSEMFWSKSGDLLGKQGADPYPGIRTTKKTKRIGCANLKDVIEKSQFIVDDYIMIKELSTFVQSKGGTYEADEGSHDDQVMCGVLYAWLITQPFFKDLWDKDIRNKMYHEEEMRIENELLPFFVTDGQELEETPESLGMELLH